MGGGEASRAGTYDGHLGSVLTGRHDFCRLVGGGINAVGNEPFQGSDRDGLTPADSARYDAASAAFDALLRHVYPGLSPLAADRLRDRVVHFGWNASGAAVAVLG